jgi:hypothetical protein
MMSWPIRDYPLNIRPVFPFYLYRVLGHELTKGLKVIIFLTGAWLILLGILGMAPLPTIPINDKALHFFGVRPRLAIVRWVADDLDGICDFFGLFHYRSSRVSCVRDVPEVCLDYTIADELEDQRGGSGISVELL